MDENMDLEIIELLDEEGQPARFEHIMTMSYNNSHYLVLHPLDDPEVDEGGVVFLEMAKDENGEEVFRNVESEILADELFDEFLHLVDSIENGDADIDEE